LSRTLLILGLLGLVGCTSLPQRSYPAVLVGTWLPLENGIEHPLACASGLPISYEHSGRYLLFEEQGQWRLDGDRLTEVATAATEAGDPAEVAFGKPFVSTIRLLGRNRFLKRLGDGSQLEFRRCPATR